MPFGQIIDTWDGQETFDPDCVFDDVDSAKLSYEHGETIGRITNAEPREDGCISRPESRTRSEAATL